MLVTQSVCCDVFDGDVWLGKYCAKIFAIGIFLRILTGIDTTVPRVVSWPQRKLPSCCLMASRRMAGGRHKPD